MSLEIKKLRELAEKSIESKPTGTGCEWRVHYDYEKAANPETVIALLDRIEKLDSALSDAIVSLKQLKHSGLITEKAWDAVTDSIEKLFVLRRGEP